MSNKIKGMGLWFVCCLICWKVGTFVPSDPVHQESAETCDYRLDSGG